MDKEADAEGGAVLEVVTEEEIGGEYSGTKGGSGGTGGPGAAHNQRGGTNADIVPVKRAAL